MIRGQGAIGFQLGERIGGGDEELRAAMREDRLDLCAAVRHVDRAHHGAEARDGEVQEQKFGRVGKLDRHHVALLDAFGAQAFGEAQHAIVQIAPGQRAGGRDHCWTI